MTKQQSLRAGFTLAEVVVCTAIAGMTFVFAAPALNKGRAATDRLRCENNLRQLSQSMLMYANDHGGLPPMAVSYPGVAPNLPGTGQWHDSHGWYSLVGAYIGEPEWAATLNLTRSMSDTVNAAARRGGLRLKIYACPAGIGLQRDQWESGNWARVLSNYVVNVGNTNYGQTPLNGVPFQGAPFAGGVITPLATVTDGLTNTLMMSEVLVLPGTPIAGATYSNTQVALGGQIFTGFNPPNSTNVHDGIGLFRLGNVSTAVGEARYLAAGFTQENWPISVTPNSPTATYIAARSKHPGGVNASLCDGSAGFIADGIDQAVWRALSSAQGGEFVPPTQSIASGYSK